ncbi:MAG TPA: alpha/beta fold hydrolase [Burkholderiaceae bacterium]|nr:alpha/beta fold hydrolase [Burkholderiaceae bacterium]
MHQPVAILAHGMGRTPFSMALLAYRLRRQGFRTAVFGYSVTVEKFPSCLARLQRFIQSRCAGQPYIVVGHSLGAVLLRCVLPKLSQLPVACFFLASPAQVCGFARLLAPSVPYRLVAGEMGQLLADETFMQSVPIPRCPTWIYAGTGGPTSRFYPLGDEPNDGILKVSETRLPGVPVVLVPAMHTFMMNSRRVVQHLLQHAHAAVAATLHPVASPSAPVAYTDYKSN